VASPGTPLTAALHKIREDLVELEVAYALVGGLAVSARAEPRLTRDVDLAIKVADDAGAEHVIRQLIGRGYKVKATVEQVTTGRLATARLTPPGNTTLVVDLLFASCGIEPEIVEQAETLEILPKIHVPVAHASHLIAMKLLARDDRDRPQDADDIRALLPSLGARDRKRVQAAIALILKRGYARGRDLAALWRAVSRTPR
jgi:predicted nucleotidyltransferase